MRTHTVKAADISGEWYVIDADDRPLGRLATDVARILRGKHRPDFSPHLDLGDHVVVINADKIYLSGSKFEQKVYYSYSGYQSGLKVKRVKDIMENDPAKVVTHAVRGMLPSNRLGRRLLKKLRVYAGPKHPHTAQKPKAFPTGK
ncbi:MAG: 50S ribosomal protein L13 [Candidatus Latescibacterota bacterium]|nr:MAG: 50S ribosomal protein L13 [Candidatus Latescibacterota bacterium]